MILVAALILCVATVPLFGGRIVKLGNIQFHRAWAGLAALALQYSIMQLFPEGSQGLHGILHLASYGLMFYFLAANLAIPGLWLIGLGGACNALAIAANNGVMPAQPTALATAGIIQVPGEFANSAAVEDPKLWLLGDVFATPAGMPMANVFSVGDILLIVGAFILLHRVTRSRLAPLIEAAAGGFSRAAPQLIREQQAFRRLWLAQGISSIGDWIYPVAAVMAVMESGGDEGSALALLLIAMAGPGMLVATFGAPLVDRFSRKRMMLWTDIARGLAVGTLLLSGSPSLAHMCGVAAVIGVGSSLNQPAFLATVPNVVPAKLLAQANSVVAITLSLTIVMGMALGAYFEQFGFAWGFAANAISFAFSAALVAGTVMPRHVPELTESMVREMRIGFRYVLGNRNLLAVLVVLGLITLGAGLKQVMEQILAYKTLDEGASGFALVNVVWAIGMLAGGFFAVALDRRMGHGPLLTWSTLIAGACIFVAAGAPSLGPVLLLWVVGGVANTLGTVAYETLVQQETPDAVRGRVFAALEAATQGGLLAGFGVSVGLAWLIDGDPARLGMAIAGLIFVGAGLASWALLRDREPVAAPEPAFGVRGVKMLDGGPSLALLRVSTEGARSAPVLLVDDGTRVHRVEALPGLNGGSFGYGVPKRLLVQKHAALALETRESVVDVSWPVRAG